MKIFPATLLILAIWSCTNSPKENITEKYKSEILETEKAFAAMAMEEGIPKAFINYADDSAVLLRNDSLIIGKSAVADYYNAQNFEGVTLKWTVDFVDVSAAGDLGYTFGKYNFSLPDSAGKSVTYTGIFHTVWKKQQNGSWKFVWD